MTYDGLIPVTSGWIEVEFGVATRGGTARFRVREDMDLTWSRDSGAELQLTCGVTAKIYGAHTRGVFREILKALEWKKPE